MQIARKRLAAETSRRYHLFGAELQRVQGELATKGLGRSGALIQAVADVCAKEVEGAGDRLWEIVRDLLREAKSTPSDEAVRTLYDQIDELWVPYCSVEPEGQFEAICQRDGLALRGRTLPIEVRVLRVGAPRAKRRARLGGSDSLHHRPA